MNKQLVPIRFVSTFSICIILSICMFFITACRKTETSQTIEPDLTKSFFTLPENISLSLRKVSDDIKMQNGKYNFITSFVKKNGIPVWDKVISNMAILNNPNSNQIETISSTTDTSIFFIPLQSPNSEINSYITCLQAGNNFFYKLYQKTALTMLTNIVDSVLGKGKIIPALSIFAKFENSINGKQETIYNSNNLEKIKDVTISFNGVSSGKTAGTIQTESFDYFTIEICNSAWMPEGWVTGVAPGANFNYGNNGQNCTIFSGYVWVDNAPNTGDGQSPVWWEEGGNSGGGSIYFNYFPNYRIIDSLQGFPCAQAILAQLPSCNDEVSRILDSIFNVNENVNLFYIADTTLTKDSLINGYAIKQFGGTTGYDQAIFLNAWMLKNSSSEYIASTMLHEGIHSYIDYWFNRYLIGQIDSILFKQKFPIFWNYRRPLTVQELGQHNEMANNYVGILSRFVKKYNPSISDSMATALAWKGLQGTTAWQNRSDTNQITNLQRIARRDLDTTSYSIYNLSKCN